LVSGLGAEAILKMMKHMKIVDVLASVLLVGMISATVLGQVGPPHP